MEEAPEVQYWHSGECPICDIKMDFISYDLSNRDCLVCANCPISSVPRERALALVLKKILPNWRELRIHESSPAERGVSVLLRSEGEHYIATHLMDKVPLGESHGKFRCENLEKQTFIDNVFDLVVSLDVMEHVNQPELAFKEIYRTLSPGGYYIFTAPTYKHVLETYRISEYREDGTINFFSAPEYHGNPVSEEGSAVTFHYGYDLPQLISKWSGFDVEVRRFHDQTHGIIGEMTEVYVCRKPS
jgi:hypothetical protein